MATWLLICYMQCFNFELNERLILLSISQLFNVIACFILNSDPFQPNNLTYTVTDESVTVIIWHPLNTANVSQYIAKINSLPGVSPVLRSSQEVNTTGTDPEVKFMNLAAASGYTIEVTSVVYGECSQPVRCRYESRKPATIAITTAKGL